ncbi:MAG TPA: zinc ribbon domain-containing protein [Anaerolineales bacterium]|nr:zinc ribbon domain-containing protein [Anaerolineales bacterium]
MRCQECGQEVPEGARFCGYCGHRLIAGHPAPVASRPIEAFDDDAPTRPETPPAPRGVQAGAPPAAPAAEEDHGREAHPAIPVGAVEKRGWGRRLAWLAGVVAGIVLLSLVAAYGLGRQPRATPAPSGPTEISLNGGDQSVPADTPIVLRIGWITDTEGQVGEFLEAIDLQVWIDGVPLENTQACWGPVGPEDDLDGNGDAEFISEWECPIGILGSGTHMVRSEGVLRGPISDGWDNYEGSILNHELQIQVE